MNEIEDRLRLLESEIERRLVERFAALRDEFDRLRVESDRRWEGFLSRFDQNFEGIVPPELLSPLREEKAEPGPAGRRGSISLEAARSLDAAANQVDALHRFLDLCRQHASRAALLVVRGSSLGVWKAVGFSELGGNDEDLRRVVLPTDRDESFRRVLDGSPLRLSRDNAVSASLSASNAMDAVLVPMVVKEKISGAIYADCVEAERDRFDPDAIGLLTFLAGLTVDRLASRKLRPAPPLKPAESVESAGGRQREEERAPEREPEFHREPVPEPRRRPEPEPASMESIPYPRPAATAERAEDSPSKTVAIDTSTFRAHEPQPSAREREPEMRDASALAEAGETPELAQVDEEPAPPRFGRAPEAAPPPPLRSAPPAPEPVAMDFDSSATGGAARPPDFLSSAARPSAGTRRLAGPLAPAEGDERREEARRFAKLLVSEIKLYNERAVLEGREHGDLYDRLKEDIDRSRQMYDDRIPEDVRANSNFFYEELVRVLADGRAESLGMG